MRKHGFVCLRSNSAIFGAHFNTTISASSRSCVSKTSPCPEFISAWSRPWGCRQSFWFGKQRRSHVGSPSPSPCMSSPCCRYSPPNAIVCQLFRAFLFSPPSAWLRFLIMSWPANFAGPVLMQSLYVSLSFLFIVTVGSSCFYWSSTTYDMILCRVVERLSVLVSVCVLAH